ncbi:hypothetical protein AB2E40_24730 (plasmid) [Escherichia coli]
MAINSLIGLHDGYNVFRGIAINAAMAEYQYYRTAETRQLATLRFNYHRKGGIKTLV